MVISSIYGQGEVILNQQQQAGGSRFLNHGVPGFNAGGVVGGNTY
jgi:hypothetical protein